MLIFIAALSFVFFSNFLSLCRKAQRRIDLLKQQIEDSLEKELVAHKYLTSIVMLAEKTTYERDQLIHMVANTNIPPPTYTHKQAQRVRKKNTLVPNLSHTGCQVLILVGITRLFHWPKRVYFHS